VDVGRSSRPDAHRVRLLLAAAIGAVGCSSSPAPAADGGSSTPPWTTTEAPFAWDAGADVSPACALEDCLSYVASRCTGDQDCIGETQSVMEPNAIVIDACMSDGSRVHVIEYGSGGNEWFYLPDGGECLAIVGDQYLDPAGQPLAQLDGIGSTNSVETCGGMTMTNAVCGDKKPRRNLFTIGALLCNQGLPPCKAP
jgi:hypothetical protein